MMICNFKNIRVAKNKDSTSIVSFDNLFSFMCRFLNLLSLHNSYQDYETEPFIAFFSFFFFFYKFNKPYLDIEEIL